MYSCGGGSDSERHEDVLISSITAEVGASGNHEFVTAVVGNWI